MASQAPDLDHAVLARRIAASDPRALAALHDEVHDPLHRYAVSLVRDAEVAGDLVQDAFVRLWTNRAELDEAGSPRALLFRTVRNLAFNHLRDERTRGRLLEEWSTPLGWRDPGPEATLAERELAAQLARWIAALPERQREVLSLSRWDGLTHDEIAAVLGIAPRTVNNHLVRALETLRERMMAGSPAGGDE